MYFPRRNASVKIALLFVLALWLSFSVSYAQNTKPLTNADVLRMSKKGIAENVIVTAIETNESEFDTSVDAIIQLHDGGVSSTVIAAMQNAQKRKKQPDTTRPSRITTSPNIKIVDEANSKSPSIPTQEAGFFTVAVNGCDKSGTSVVCNLTVTNNGQDRRFYPRVRQSSVTDDTSTSAQASLANIGGKEINEWSAAVSGEAGPLVLENSSIKAQMHFRGVSTNAQRIGRLTIAFSVLTGNGDERFEVKFRDIPFEKPAVKSSKPAQ